MEQKSLSEPGFNPEFLNVRTSQIIRDIRRQGFFAFEGALKEEYVDDLLKDVDFDQFLLNTNDVGVVATQNNKYLTHCLASSQKTYDVITSSKILAICREYFTDDYKLINHRIYQTSKKQHLSWHTDNNMQKGAKMAEKHNMPGLFFMFYLSDVEKNPFQLVKGSHLWSQNFNKESFFTDSFINSHHLKDVVTFKLKKGSLILCDIHGIHRAEPFNDAKYSRSALLFQVDQVGKDNAGHGEKNIINTEYLENVTPEISNYLGFGFKRNYPAFPDTSLVTMTNEDIFRLQKNLLSKSFKAITQNIGRTILPPSLITNIKRYRYKRQKTLKQ